MKTLILTRQDIEAVLTPSVANETVERAFRAYGFGLAEMPPKSYLPLDEGDLRSMPAYLHGQGFHIGGIKSVTVHTGNASHGLPTVMAVVILNDPDTGFPLAILDGTYLTAMRTGAAGALAVKVLSRKDAEVAGFVGCGVQARAQLSCILETRKIKKVKLWQFSGEERRTTEFGDWIQKTYGLDVLVSANIDDITQGADILVTSTPSRSPLVTRISAGTHINAIGADARGKQEIDPTILQRAKIVVDDWIQASHSGEVNVPVVTGRLSRADIHAELGEIVAGKATGRTSDGEITVFDATGLAIEDISCACAVYKAFKDRPDTKTVQLF